MRLVIALGGNMLSDATHKGEPFSDQLIRVKESAKLIADIVSLGHQVIITHGNGPQVGSLLLQQQTEHKAATQLPLEILTALTQGQIGVTLQHALLNEFHARDQLQPVIVIPTTSIVHKDDPALANPSKPIGPFYKIHPSYTAASSSFKEFSQGFRRVVPSPIPVDILELATIQQLAESAVVVCVGGGGTPSYLEDGQLHRIDAVIDKDRGSALLATLVKADLLVILTNIDGVYHNYNSPNKELISHLTLSEAKALLQDQQLESGSMAPKVTAGVVFAPLGDTIITSPEKVILALEGQAGTRITADP